MILQSLSYLEKQGQLGNNHEDRKEEKTNGAYGSRSRRRYIMDRDDIVRDDRSLDTPNKWAKIHGFYSISDFEGDHHHYHEHPYWRSERGYFPDEFRKAKPPTFVGEVKKSVDA